MSETISCRPWTDLAASVLRVRAIECAEPGGVSRIEPARLRMAEDWIRRQRIAWEDHLDRLGEYLADKPHP